MKKLRMLLILVFMMTMVLCVVALAETVGSSPDAGYSWPELATIAGATAATLLIVQFLKLPMDKVWKIPTRGFAYIIALLIMVGANVFTGGFVLEEVPLLAVNAFIVAAAAMGTYQLTFKKIE